MNSVGRRGLEKLARNVARDVKTNDSLSTQEQGGTTPIFNCNFRVRLVGLVGFHCKKTFAFISQKTNHIV